MKVHPMVVRKLVNTEIWCNGSTRVFGTLGVSSILAISAKYLGVPPGYRIKFLSVKLRTSIYLLCCVVDDTNRESRYLLKIINIFT